MRYTPEPLGTLHTLRGSAEVYNTLRRAFPRETTAFVGCILRTRHDCHDFEVWKVDGLFVRILGDVECFAGGSLTIRASARTLAELLAKVARLPDVLAMTQTERTLRCDLGGLGTDRFGWVNETDWACGATDGEDRLAAIHYYAFPSLYVVRPEDGHRPREFRNRQAVVRCLRALRALRPSRSHI